MSAEGLKAQRERASTLVRVLGPTDRNAELRRMQRAAYELGFTAGMRTQAGEVAIDTEDYCFRDGVWQPDIDKLLDRGE